MSPVSGLRSSLAAPFRAPPVVAGVAVLGTASVLAFEWLLGSGHLQEAIAGYLLCYVCCTLASLRLRQCLRILQAFAVVAVFRLVNLAMPAFTDLTLYWLPLIYLAVTPALFVAWRTRAVAERAGEPTAPGDGTGAGSCSAEASESRDAATPSTDDGAPEPERPADGDSADDAAGERAEDSAPGTVDDQTGDAGDGVSTNGAADDAPVSGSGDDVPGKGPGDDEQPESTPDEPGAVTAVDVEPDVGHERDGPPTDASGAGSEDAADRGTPDGAGDADDPASDGPDGATSSEADDQTTTEADDPTADDPTADEAGDAADDADDPPTDGDATGPSDGESTDDGGSADDGRGDEADDARPLVKFVVFVPTLLALGAGLGVAGSALAPDSAIVPELTTEASVLLALVVAFAAVAEEVLFRGLLQSAVTARLGRIAGVVLASAVFAALHVPAGPTPFATALLAGLVYGTVYEYVGTLLAPALVHGLVNLLVYVLLPTYGGGLAVQALA